MSSDKYLFTVGLDRETNKCYIELYGDRCYITKNIYEAIIAMSDDKNHLMSENYQLKQHNERDEINYCKYCGKYIGE